MSSGHLRSLVACLAAALGASAGCVDISGGAVEIAWVIRGTDQKAAECGDANPDIAELRLSVVPVANDATDLCAAGAVKGCHFDCSGDNGSGITAFAVPAGDYYLGLVAVSADGTDLPPERVAVPPPLPRTIQRGEVSDLGVWQVVILEAP
jgi:hypothetical protein